MSIAAQPLGTPRPPLLVPRTLCISSSSSITLQNNQSSSYTSMSLYIDLIEHTVVEVLRNPVGALFPSSQQSQTISPLKPFKSIHHVLCFFLLSSVNYLLSCLHLPPLLRSAPPLLSLQSALLCSSPHSLTYTPHLMLWICEAKKPAVEVSQSVSLSSSQSDIFQPDEAKAFLDSVDAVRQHFTLACQSWTVFHC